MPDESQRRSEAQTTQAAHRGTRAHDRVVDSCERELDFFLGAMKSGAYHQKNAHGPPTRRRELVKKFAMGRHDVHECDIWQYFLVRRAGSNESAA